MTPIFLVIALLPGAIAWWSSRGLEKLKDDPALPELLFARRSRINSVMWFAIIATSFAEDPLYRFGLFVLSTASPYAGGYPLGRKLFGYTIGFFGYLGRGLRTLIAGVGPLIVLIYLPTIITSVPEPWRVATLLLVPLMIAWSWWYVEIWRALSGARPLTNADLNLRIDNVARRASVKPPPLSVYGSDAMKVMNAVALRGPRPGIALGNGLIEMLEPDEVAAVYAHEIAHIEQIPPRELRMWRLIGWVEVLVGVVGFYMASENLSQSTVALLSSAWGLLVLGMLLWQQKRSRRHETESDLRAAELTGDPELVARALVKVHLYGLIPRRWSANFERSASHPSLARRIQALRGSSISAPIDAQPTIIQTGRPSRVVAFDANRAYWFEGVPQDTQRELGALREQASGMRAASWNDLVELRIAAETEDDRSLVATHKNGETWTVPIPKADVGAVQKFLDRVDSQLHGGLQTRTSKLSPRALLGAAALVMFFTSPGLLILPLIVALFRPSTAMLAGVAGILATDAALELKHGSILSGYWTLVPRILALGVATVLLVVAHQRARADRRDGLQFTLILLALAAAIPLLATGVSLTNGLSSLWGDESLRGLAPCLVGIGAALLITARREARIGGAVTLAAGLAAAALMIAGPVASGENFSTETADLREVRRLDFPVQVITGLEVSPGGRGILVEGGSRGDDRHGEWQLRYDDSLWIMPVMDAGFVDSTRVLSLWAWGDSLQLRMERLDTTMVEWVMPLPALRAAKLTTRPSNRSWAVVGVAPASDSLVIVSGALDQEESPIITLAPIDSMIPGIMEPGPSGRSVISLRMSIDSKAGLVKAALLRRGFTWQLWESSEKGVRRVGEIDGIPVCGSSGSAALRCITVGGREVVFWQFNGDSVQKEAVLAGGQFYRTNLGASGLITMLKYDGGEIQFGDPTTMALLRATAPIGGGMINFATAQPGRLWLAVRSPARLSVIEYAVSR